MRTYRRLAIGLIVLVQALASLPVRAPLSALAEGEFSSAAGTVVTVEGSVVTMTVSIDLALGGVGATEVPEGAQAEADRIAGEAAGYWNQGFERLSTDCLQFRLVVKINVVPQADAHLLIIDEDSQTWVTVPGHHVAFWGENDYGNAAPPETYDEYDEDGIAPPGEDYTTPLEHELWTMWSPDLETTRDFAHEIGHLMGFGDDYANGEPLPGREGTLMDSGDLIDQNLVNRFADIARHSGQQLPECWDGKVTGTSMQPGCTPATVPVTGEVALSVKADGSVTGSSTERRGAFSCGGAPAPAFDVDYEITGRKTASAFELSIQGTPVTLPIVGDTATTTIEHVNGGFGVSVTYTVTCRTCSEET